MASVPPPLIFKAGFMKLKAGQEPLREHSISLLAELKLQKVSPQLASFQ